VQGSLEGGYPFHVGAGGLELEPQLQLIFQHLNFPVLTEADGMSIWATPTKGFCAAVFA
jgi:outer membrane autotransporter protein